LTVSTYVSLRNGCALDYRVVDTEEVGVVEFTVGGGGQEPFMIVFDAPALREFLNRGSTALLQLDARTAGGTA
jgi:hypothetical protein